jgi:DNA-binding response OmpR family regulator
MSLLAGCSVLLVEDEYLIALDAEQMLRDMGVREVEIVSTFENAQNRTQAGTFDVAVLDVNINGQLSFPIAEILKARGIPFVFATGYSLRERPIAGFEGGICVSKPYTQDGLRKALAAALGKDEKSATRVVVAP